LQRPRTLQRTAALLRTGSLLLLLRTGRSLGLVLLGLSLLVLALPVLRLLVLRLSLIARSLCLCRRCPQQRSQRNTLRLECKLSHVTQPDRPGSPAATA
jgi:hypothetical protein